MVKNTPQKQKTEQSKPTKQAGVIAVCLEGLVDSTPKCGNRRIAIHSN